MPPVPGFPDHDFFEDFPEEGALIQFFSEDVDFGLKQPDEVDAWLREVVISEGCHLNGVSYIFCSDEYLHRLNVDFLQHDTYTDVITFPYAEPPQIEGDIYISIDRVKENGDTFGSGFEAELHRVMAHGMLHLCGYGDKTEEEERVMREKENAYLGLWTRTHL